MALLLGKWLSHVHSVGLEGKLVKGGMEEDAKGWRKRHQRIDPSKLGPGTCSPKKILTPITSAIIKMHQNSVFISQNFILAPPAPICKTLVIDIGDYGQDSKSK